MNDFQKGILYCIIGIICFLLGIIVHQLIADNNTTPLLSYNEQNTYIAHTSCSSHSMRPFIECSDFLELKEITASIRLQTGNIYVYDKEGYRVIHRLVYDCRSGGCDGNLIFKGDDNKRAEIIKSEDISGEFIRIISPEELEYTYNDNKPIEYINGEI